MFLSSQKYQVLCRFHLLEGIPRGAAWPAVGTGCVPESGAWVTLAPLAVSPGALRPSPASGPLLPCATGCHLSLWRPFSLPASLFWWLPGKGAAWEAVFLWHFCMDCGIFVPGPGMEPRPSAVKAWSPDHYMTGELLGGKFCDALYLWKCFSVVSCLLEVAFISVTVRVPQWKGRELTGMLIAFLVWDSNCSFWVGFLPRSGVSWWRLALVILSAWHRVCLLQSVHKP